MADVHTAKDRFEQAKSNSSALSKTGRSADSNGWKKMFDARSGVSGRRLPS